eukprot:TRINITY_DN67873_c0_g1_i1.p1 TRINITY_DN67873_c0_g1~~TRINITY_DN67873_c0_g1_i1.p1  ORF type:complete len:217 (-),score=37.39 TRINITY_DN67873_c0_g1_i1:73-723(-)
MGITESLLSRETGFDKVEIKTLREKYDVLCRKPGTVQKHQLDLTTFCSHFPPSQQEMAATIFKAFDKSGNGIVDFREFVVAMAVLMQGTEDDKVDFCLLLCGCENREIITREQFRTLTASFFAPFRRVLEYLPDEESAQELQELRKHEENMRRYTDVFFGTVNRGSVTRAEFRAFCQEHPDMFQPLNMVLSAVKRASLWDWETGMRPPPPIPTGSK